MRVRILCSCALLTVGAGADEGGKLRAEQKLAVGVTLYEEGRFKEALDTFEEAYEAFPAPRILLNMAAAFDALGNPVRALESYERFLREAEVQRDAELIARTGEEIARIVGRVSELEFRAPEGTQIQMDGQWVGRAPISGRVRVQTGAHDVLMRSPTGVAHSVRVSTRGGERVVVEAPKAWSPRVAKPQIYTADPITQGSPLSRQLLWGGVALATAGVIVALLLVSQGDSSPDYDGSVDFR